MRRQRLGERSSHGSCRASWAEIRSIFSPEVVRLYLEHLERMDSQEGEAVTAEGGNDDLGKRETGGARSSETAGDLAEGNPDCASLGYRMTELHG